MTILEKTQKYAKQNFFARLKSRYKSVLFTGIQLLIFSCFSFQGESKNLTPSKYCILYQKLLEVSPFNEHWNMSKLMAIWFWGHFSLYFSYHWYSNSSMYVRYPSSLYYLRSALTYVGIYPPPLVWKFSGSLPFILVLSGQLIDMALNVQQCKSIHQCKQQGKKLQKIFRLIWYEDFMLFATLSQTLSLFCNTITFCKKCKN